VEGEVYFQHRDSTPLAKNYVPPIPPDRPFGFPRLNVPTNSQGKYAILEATVHPVSGPAIERGVILVEDGKIKAVAEMGKLEVPADATIVSAKGLHAYPGMLEAASVVGLTEIGSARETNDFAEGGDFQPDLRAASGINPDSEIIPVTRANGVLAVVTRPSGPMIAGQGALVNLNGWVPAEMVLADPLALYIDLPVLLPIFTGDPTAPSVARVIAKKQRDLKMKRVRELFQQAIAYQQGRKAGARAADPRLEALAPYAQGEKIVVIQAQRKGDIEEALRLADELKLKVVISGGIEAWKVADELKKRDIPVILGPVMTMPQMSTDTFDAPYRCAAKLHAAGVRFCIRSGGSTNTRNLPYEAAMAVSYGLPADEGLKSVTLYPAQIMGVADRLGTLEAGKIANIVLTDGSLLQATTQVRGTFVGGVPVEPSSKHTKLYERYRERIGK
jgi:imidazolonepropionase-like amidohydrolase